jgi:hypothetical protein
MPATPTMRSQRLLARHRCEQEYPSTCSEAQPRSFTRVRTKVRAMRLSWRVGLGSLCTCALILGLLSGACASEAGAELVDQLTWRSPALIDSPSPGLNGLRGLRAISCPTVSLCAAIDASGNVVTSTDPGGADTWNVAHVDSNTTNCGYPVVPCQARFLGVSCVSISWCLAWDEAGYVLTSTAPTIGAAGWSNTKIIDPMNDRLRAVSCPSASLCVAVGGQGDVFTSTTPAGSRDAWHSALVDSGPCPLGANSGTPTVPLCHDKSLGTGPPGPRWLLAISCPSVALCVAGDAEGNVLTSTDPTGGPGAWKVTYVDHEIEAGSMAVDDQAELISIACPSVSLCIASDGAGNVLTSKDPTGGASAWTLRRVVHVESAPPTALEDLSCPSTMRCLGLYRHGTDYADVNYDAFGEGSWNPVSIDGVKPPPSVSCPSSSPLCVTADATGISCPSTQLCVAVDEAGNAIIGEARPLSISRIKVLLRAAARPRRRPSIGCLLRRGSISLPFVPLLEGQVRIRWRTARIAKGPHPGVQLIASGQYNFRTLASRRIKLRLTRVGRKVLRQHHRLAMTSEITFSPLGSKPITATGALVLRR